MLSGYDYFREEGLPIGSGEVETAIALYSPKALEDSGATWHPDIVNPMLVLRITLTSG